MSAIASLLHYAAAHVPRYYGLKPALGSFPILIKSSAAADFAAHLSNELGSEKPKLVEFLRDENRRCGPNDEAAFGSRIIIEETSGSSGIPFRTAKTLQERASLSYAIWKYRRQIDPLCSPRNFYPIFHRSAQTPTLGKARDFTPSGVDNFYAELASFGIRWVHGGASVLRQHAELISPKMAEFKSVSFAENTSVALSDNDRQFIEAKLAVALIDQYGCRETWAIAVRKDAGCFHILSENVVVELLDDAGNPVMETERRGRVTVTSLHQRIFPIIRYDTGDLGSWSGGAVGHRLKLSNYRQHNLLRCKDREIDGNQLFRKILGEAYRLVGYAPLHYIQIRQVKPHRFVLAVGKSGKMQDLCAALNQICRSHDCFSPGTRFELRELSVAEIEAESLQKPSLFTTKYLDPDSIPFA
jgi:phenylacetate-CoA ligase